MKAEEFDAHIDLVPVATPVPTPMSLIHSCYKYPRHLQVTGAMVYHPSVYKIFLVYEIVVFGP